MTKLLTIGLLLFSCGIAAADERHKPGDVWPKGDGCNTCEIDQYGTASCTAMYCYDSSAVNETTCELKMKEVMREIDEILRLNHGLLMDRDPGKPRICLNLSQHAYRQWERVMKECAK